MLPALEQVNKEKSIISPYVSLDKEYRLVKKNQEKLDRMKTAACLRTSLQKWSRAKDMKLIAWGKMWALTGKNFWTYLWQWDDGRPARNKRGPSKVGLNFEVIQQRAQ